MTDSNATAAPPGFPAAGVLRRFFRHAWARQEAVGRRSARHLLHRLRRDRGWRLGVFLAHAALAGVAGEPRRADAVGPQREPSDERPGGSRATRRAEGVVLPLE